MWWSHFQVQGHIFGQVVTLYQIYCTKTYKAFSVRLSAFFIRRTPAVHKTVAFRLTRSRRFALLIQNRKFHFSRFRILYFSVILSQIPWFFKGIVLTAGKQSHTRVLFKIYCIEALNTRKAVIFYEAGKTNTIFSFNAPCCDFGICAACFGNFRRHRRGFFGNRRQRLSGRYRF